MKYLYIILVMLSYTSIAQNTISGKITDKNTNEPIDGVNLYIESLHKGSSTDANGYYEINELPNGTYEILITALGYETIHYTLNIQAATKQDFTLKATALELDDIIISTPFHKLQQDNVMKVEKVKTSELTSANNLSEQLSQIAGVNQISTGNGIGKPVIRGLSANRVLVYTQGVRLENQQYGAEHGLGVESNGIESVEVIKGPASLLYGSDAIGGVLFLNPEKYAAREEFKVDAASNYYTNTNGLSTNFGLKSTTEDLKFIARFGTQQHADYQYNDTRVSNTRFSSYDLKTGLGFGKKNIITDVRYNLNFSKIGIPEEIDAQNSLKTPMLPYQSVTNHVLSSHTKVLFEKSKLDINLGYTFNKRKEYEEEHDHDEEEHEEEEHEDHDEHEEEHHDEELEPALHMNLSTFNYNIKYELPEVNDFEIVIGSQGMFQTNNNFGEEILIPDANTIDIGLFGTAHYHWNKNALQFGVRYDNRSINTKQTPEINEVNRSFSSVNGALGFKTNLTDKIITRINLATGFRAPNLSELTSDGVHHGSNRYEIGDANLDNEQNFQVDLNLSYKSEHFEWFTNAFYNHINNYIYLSPNGQVIDNTAVFNYVQENAALYGGELGIHLHPHPLDWLHVESSFEMVIGKVDNDYLPLIPANSINTRLQFDVFNKKEKPLKLNAFTNLKNVLAQNLTNTNETSSNAYNLVSLGSNFNYQTKKVNYGFNITVTNLFDTKYIDHLSRLKTDGIYNQGRNIIAGLNISF